MNVVIRVKVSHQAGFGHWVRQCHLAQALAQTGCSVTLFPDRYEHIGTIPEGVDLVPVDDNAGFLESLTSPLDLAILDIHDTTADFISKVKAVARRIAGFEDLGEGRNHLDCLIDSNLPEKSASAVSGSVKTLFGWHYSLLAPEYETIAIEPRDFSNGIRSALITMGGTDPRQLTAAVLAPLLENFPNLNVTVVTGPGFTQRDVLEPLLENPQVAHHSQPASLAPLFLSHDAVICAGGVTLHEAIAAGTPSFVVPQVEHQAVLTRRLEEQGAATLIGKPGKVDRDRLIEAMKNSPESLNAMSQQGRLLIDGRGLRRIAQSLLQLTKPE